MSRLRDLLLDISDLLMNNVPVQEISEKLMLPLDWVRGVSEQEWLSEYTDFSRFGADTQEVSETADQSKFDNNSAT